MTNDQVYQGSYRKQLRSNPETQKKIEKKIIRVGTMDYTIFLVVVILVMLGVIMVFSSSYLTAANREIYNYDMFYFLKKQASFAIMGFCAMIIMANISYRYLKRLSGLIYITSNVLLVSVLMFSVAVKGAKRWIELPVIGQFQPSEMAKVGIILFVSYIIAKNEDILKRWSGFFFCCAIVGVTAVLVALGNLSTAIITCVIGIGIIFIASPYILRFFVFGGLAGGSLVFYLAYLADWIAQWRGEVDFRAGRFDAWLDPFSDPAGYGYQAIQSLFAIASGGMFGLGIGQSRQKSFVPEAHNDIIFSIICEELGFVGAAMVLMLFGVLIWRGMKVAINAPDTYSSLVAAGIVILVASQVVINVAVVTNTIPNTGVPMPFISSGGTSLIVTMALMGILLNISRCSKDVNL